MEWRGQPGFGYLPGVHLRAERLTKKFGWATALDGLSWNLEPGQIVALLGSNGAGKTTLLNMLAGCLLPDSGQVFMDDRLYTPDSVDLRRRFAFIPDIPPVPGGWSPLRFISSTLMLYGVTDDGLEARVMGILEQLDLREVAAWKLRQLSRGQAYKAVLAAFLAADPELWLVDEPFASGMDPRGLSCFKEYAREAIGRGRTIVFTTQIIEVAEQFAHRICVIERGRIVADDTPERLRATPAFASLVNHLRENPAP